ncbi:unnamed protein product [Bemisia tabaci]|uniref:Sec20 C-terminal domain-containing protein n=1 Tax=Bemisia tabaci TaxID=7038 RepID=A0A9P0A5L6_BEMTA|nr:PREDICTED: uncharacterized protein LOC109043433 [Bemisia tabaci]CAH0384744.1 unnamed protein product [Bemisia tabaci]
MDGLQPVAVDTRQNLIKINLALKANIYDIYHCEGPPEVLEKLNAHGRRLIADFRRLTHDLEFWAKEEDFKRNEEELLAVLNNCREQLLRSVHPDFRAKRSQEIFDIEVFASPQLIRCLAIDTTCSSAVEYICCCTSCFCPKTFVHVLRRQHGASCFHDRSELPFSSPFCSGRTTAEFKKANIACLQAIERSNKAQLLHSEIDSNTQLKNRTKKDKVNLIKKSTNITDRLLSISRHLAETIEQNSKTLDSLVISSSNVTGIRDELRSTGSVINQSGKLVRKYDQREFTSKLMIFAGFALFLAVCLSIVYNRLF